MKNVLYVLICIASLLVSVDAAGQVDKKDVRRGNRDFRKENFREAEIDYRKALVKDSMSVAANYNLANTLYREGDFAQAQQALERVKDVAPMSGSAADYYFNLGDAALQQKDYQKAVEAFGESLIRRPEDLQAKENFIYAKKMLQNQQQNQQNQNNDQNQDNQDQNQDQNQDNQNNQDQNDDQNKDQNDDQDKNDDQNKDDQQNQDQNGGQDQKEQPQGQQPKITPQAAQQMLQAIQAKEKETQDKVNKQKAEALKSRQKEKNW
ncbi:MAG: tetratricopeptide repeat protein [Bacteroidales bacterium]|jgi:tetratricopeptide (TPR) repeat protein|nr:tetratricopeptide repeat protein [Bacteroidales bacterium]